VRLEPKVALGALLESETATSLACWRMTLAPEPAVARVGAAIAVEIIDGDADGSGCR